MPRYRSRLVFSCTTRFCYGSCPLLLSRRYRSSWRYMRADLSECHGGSLSLWQQLWAGQLRMAMSASRAGSMTLRGRSSCDRRSSWLRRASTAPVLSIIHTPWWTLLQLLDPVHESVGVGYRARVPGHLFESVLTLSPRREYRSFPSFHRSSDQCGRAGHYFCCRTSDERRSQEAL